MPRSLKYIFERLGVQYELKLMSGARLEKSLENGSVDMVVSVERTQRLQVIARFLDTFSRNAEYVLMTNTQVRERHNATSLHYVKENGLKVGITNGEPYNEAFWSVYPWKNPYTRDFNDVLDVTTHVRSNLLKLSRN